MTPDQQKLRDRCLFRLIVCGEKIKTPGLRAPDEFQHRLMCSKDGFHWQPLETAPIPVNAAWEWLNKNADMRGVRFHEGPITEQVYGLSVSWINYLGKDGIGDIGAFVASFSLEAAMQPGAVTKPPEVRNG